VSVKILLFFNKFFKLPLHPFNMQNDGIKKYSMWQYEKGIETIKNYLKFCSIDEMFKNKDILDVGCGAAGKSLYYLSQGANSVIGLDVVESYKKEAYDLQRELGLDGFTFVVGDAAKTIAISSGAEGMISGQVKDLKTGAALNVTGEELIDIIEQKTMAIINSACVAGAYVAGANKDVIKKIDEFAYHLGLAFQIRDDFEDIKEDVEALNDSPNFINAMGEEKAKELLEKHSGECKKIISSFNNNQFIANFLDFLF